MSLPPSHPNPNEQVPLYPLELLHRDAHLVVINKPSGLLTHRGWANDRDTALTRVRDAVGRHVYLPHRLDRATSGALLLALDTDTHRLLCRAFAAQQVHKQYLALVRGHTPASGRIDHPIRPPDRDTALPALTDFTLEAHSAVERCSLVRVEPRTGRPHQIRRHLKHLSHPIIGDTRYGNGTLNRHYREHHALHRLGLHACSLAFTHPVTGEPLQVRAPLHQDLQRPLESLGLWPRARQPTE